MVKGKTLAIDLSRTFRVIWKEIPERVKVVMIRATEGDYDFNPMVQQQVEGALESGRIVGLYHVYRTEKNNREINPATQAEIFLHHTQEYWGDVKLQANQWEPGSKQDKGGQHKYNLRSEVDDLQTFHQQLHQSKWRAFTLIYTNLANWQQWKMENWKNAWQGPRWIYAGGLIDGLWIAELDVAQPSRLPRQFSNYWMHHFATNYILSGIYDANGKDTGVYANWIPHSLEEIRSCLGLDVLKSSPADNFDPAEIMAIYKRGWQARTDTLIEYLQQNREGEAG